MPITTKTGDKGTTSLYHGGRVSKDDQRVCTYGSLDELCAYLGFAKSLLKDRKIKNIIEAIQRELFIIGAEIATKSSCLNKLEKRIDNRYVQRLEGLIYELEDKRTFKECCFYLPGTNPLSSSLDIARTVARRVERMAVSLKREKLLKNSYILVYLNRLSDVLYLLARMYEGKHTAL